MISASPCRDLCWIGATASGQCWKSGYRARAIKEELQKIISKGHPAVACGFVDDKSPFFNREQTKKHGLVGFLYVCFDYQGIDKDSFIG